MKVLSVVPGLDPARGGMATAATNMLLAAQKAGVNSVVVVPGHRQRDGKLSRELIDTLEKAGVVVHLTSPARWPKGQAYRWGISPAQITWLVRNVGSVDLVHLHGVWGVNSLGGLPVARLASKPIVVTPHESLTAVDIDDSRSATRRRQKLFLKSAYLRHTTLFILTSDLEARQSLPPTAPQRIVHYPVADDAAPLPPLHPRGQRTALRVGFLARIDPKKNLDLLIGAMARLPTDVRLVIAGNGPTELTNSLRAQAANLGVETRLEWHGFVAPKDRVRFFDGLDLLAMPSTFESFGLSAAEAMLHGLPVLVSDQTGIAEVIRRRGGGRIVGADMASIVSAISDFDTDRTALQTLGAQGQEAVSAELTFGGVGQTLREAYSAAIELASQRRSAGPTFPS